MKEPARVLQIVATMGMGGIENFLMNLYRSIDKEKVQFDFLILNTDNNFFENEIKSLGGKIYKIVSPKKSGYFKFLRDLKDFFLKNPTYKIVHSHYNILNGIILNQVYKCKVKLIISHSHSTNSGYSILKKICLQYSKFLLRKIPSKKLACSEKAGIWLYGKNMNFKIIHNGIDLLKYKYNYEIKIRKRKELEIANDDIVIGHIGTFRKVKNHNFLINIFFELYKKNKKYKLILVGDGDLKEEVKAKVDKLGLNKIVIFLGIRNDVEELLQVFDIFLFPSLYEGLPVSLVEAQAAGLKSFISDSITKEIDFGLDLIEFISLNKSALEWADIIEEKRKYKRESKLEVIQKNGYDIKKTSEELVEIYSGEKNI